MDQSAQAQLNNDVHQLELEVRSASIRFRESNTPWLFIGERYLLVGMDPEDNHDAVSSPQLVGSDRMGDATEFAGLLNEQMSTFSYRANMGIDFARLRSPLFLDFNEQKLPVYSSTLATYRGNTFSSFLMFLGERDQPVKITNVTINSNGSSETTPHNGRSVVANFSVGEFGGATVDSKAKSIHSRVKTGRVGQMLQIFIHWSFPAKVLSPSLLLLMRQRMFILSLSIGRTRIPRPSSSQSRC